MKSLDDKYLKQSKYILNKDIDRICPLISNCTHCVVYYYSGSKDIYCSPEDKINGAKNYLNHIRTEKLKRINK